MKTADYDPFQCDRMVYTFRNTCEQEPELKYDDGVRTIFLYVYGKKGAENKELAELLRYMADSCSENVTNSEIQEIQKMVDEIKQNSEIGVRYMQSWEFRQICHEEGYKDGYDKGDHQGDSRRLIEDVENLMKNLKMDLPTACKSLGITVDVYEQAKQEFVVKQD